MTPKDILVLLDIVEKSAKTPLYAHITGAAHAALVAAQLHTVVKPNDDDEEEEPSNPPRPHAPSVRRT
jgi:hypothetical protein